MFEIHAGALASSDLPVIVEGYSNLHYDVVPILYTGFNRYGTRVLGSSVDEDFDAGVARHYRILVTPQDFASFLDRAVSYRALLEAAQSVFVLDYDLGDDLLASYLVSVADLPEDYLPTENSFAPADAGPPPEQVHRIALSGSWTLEDLSDFPETYKQVYSFLYTLQRHPDQERANNAFTAHPWAGGYSSLNFYNQLYASIPRQDRPSVRRIVYASPGYIELVLDSGIALEIRNQIRLVSADYSGIATHYRVAYSELKRRGLLGYDARARDIDWRDHTEFVHAALARLTELIGLQDRDALNRLTGNALVSLKIVLSFYRRLKDLAAYQLRNKLVL